MALAPTFMPEADRCTVLLTVVVNAICMVLLSRDARIVSKERGLTARL